MARSFIVASKPGSTAFVASVNAALAALVNPTIAGTFFNVDERQRRNQRSYSCVISYDTGGAALATPFQLSVLEAPSLAALNTALVALIAAHPTYFWAPSIFIFKYTGPRDPRYIALTLFNATAGASANYTSASAGGGGGGGGGPS